MFFTQSQIDQMKQYNLQNLLPEGWELRGRSNLAGLCPLCEMGTKDCFSINIRKNLWYCRKCDGGSGKGGTTIDFVIERENCDFGTAIRILGGLMGMSPVTGRQARLAVGTSQHKRESLMVTPNSRPTPKQNALTQLLPLIKEANERLLEPSTKKEFAARDSFYQRGITDLEIEKYQLGYLSDWVKVGELNIPPKLIIPRFVDGELMGINSKTFSNKYPKYMFTGKRGMFNGDAIGSDSAAIICEGEFDAILLSRFTTAAVVTLGGASHKLSGNEKLMLSLVQHLYVCMDGDEAGNSAYQKMVNTLGVNRVRKIEAPLGMDVTDVWKSGGDRSIESLLPEPLLIPTSFDVSNVWIGKVVQTSDGDHVTIAALFGDDIVAGTDGKPYQFVDTVLLPMD